MYNVYSIVWYGIVEYSIIYHTIVGLYEMLSHSRLELVVQALFRRQGPKEGFPAWRAAESWALAPRAW